MFEILIISAILAYATLGIGHALSKMGSHSCSSSSNYDDDHEEPIPLLSPHNSVSEITEKDGRFYITIENSITGERRTINNRFKKFDI